MDSKFRKGLPDQTYVRRLAYRGVMMQACRKLKMLDGVAITEKETFNVVQISKLSYDRNLREDSDATVEGCVNSCRNSLVMGYLH